MTLHLTSCERVPVIPLAVIEELISDHRFLLRHSIDVSLQLPGMNNGAVAILHLEDAAGEIAKAAAIRGALRVAGFDDETAMLTMQATQAEAKYVVLSARMG